MDRCFGKNRTSKWFGVEIKYETNDEDNEDELIKNSVEKGEYSGL